MTVIKQPDQDLIVLTYVVKGFWETIRQYNIDFENLTQAEGEIGVMSELIGFAALDDALYAEVAENEENCLVWPYDISEIFGQQLATYVHQNGDWPEPEHAKRMLRGIYDIAVA